VVAARAEVVGLVVAAVDRQLERVAPARVTHMDRYALVRLSGPRRSTPSASYMRTEASGWRTRSQVWTT
jgi:hypothetical protein